MTLHPVVSTIHPEPCYYEVFLTRLDNVQLQLCTPMITLDGEMRVGQ